MAPNLAVFSLIAPCLDRRKRSSYGSRARCLVRPLLTRCEGLPLQLPPDLFWLVYSERSRKIALLSFDEDAIHTACAQRYVRIGFEKHLMVRMVAVPTRTLVFEIFSGLDAW